MWMKYMSWGVRLSFPQATYTCPGEEMKTTPHAARRPTPA